SLPTNENARPEDRALRHLERGSAAAAARALVVAALLAILHVFHVLRVVHLGPGLLEIDARLIAAARANRGIVANVFGPLGRLVVVVAGLDALGAILH